MKILTIIKIFSSLTIASSFVPAPPRLRAIQEKILAITGQTEYETERKTIEIPDVKLSDDEYADSEEIDRKFVKNSISISFGKLTLTEFNEALNEIRPLIAKNGGNVRVKILENAEGIKPFVGLTLTGTNQNINNLKEKIIQLLITRFDSISDLTISCV
mmetsp:Transcript_14796/g.20998  ORF Transcript_14796/g.20998 Transcript_14796/m.20998 type:complete len:159 (-) Transcript_14796:160-636(-)